MTPTLVVQPEAEADIAEAFRWYEEKREGLGLEFVGVVDACLAAIERHPQSYAVVRGQTRRAVLRRFPYSIFYLVDGDRMVVVACVHASRSPATWQRRADSLGN